MSATPDLLAKAHGMLAGVAVGDALGMPTEFLTPETIADWYGGGVTGLTRADARHPHHRLPAGAVTDDTDHTLLLAQVLIEEGEVRPEAWAAKLLAWGRTPRVQENRFVGPSTLKALAALEAGAPLEEVPRGGTSSGAASATSSAFARASSHSPAGSPSKGVGGRPIASARLTRTRRSIRVWRDRRRMALSPLRAA